MQTSRFQLGLIAILAMCLGLSLSSTEAVGYPSAGAVSMGSNPLWARAGQLDDGSIHPVITAPADQDIVVTDISLHATGSSVSVRMFLDDGTDLAYVFANSTYDSALVSGIPVPAGKTLQLQRQYGGQLFHNFSGYYASP
jgi:hypothetical protein